jgi:uncharacterized membrane protein YfcA
LETIILFYALLFLVAFLYSSVGHGGASGYLALMALFSISPDVMKPTALLLNLFVSLTSFIQFYRGKHFNWKIFLPFAIASVPMAFVGGLITVDADVYKKILGLLLIVPITRFLFFPSKRTQKIEPLFVTLNRSSDRLSVRSHRYWWRDHSFPGFVITKMDRHEANSRYQCPIHFCKFIIGSCRTIDARN